MEEILRTKLLLDSMPYSCHLWNKKFKMFDCNEENVRLFKLKNKHEVAKNFHLFSPEYQPDGRLSAEVVAEFLTKAFDEGRFVGEYMHQTKDGEPLPVEMTLVRVKYGNDYAVAAYARDLREYKKMMAEIKDKTEKLETAMKDAQTANNTKSEFLANVSHEMRTPLNAVLGLSGLTLEMEDLNEEAAENLEKIYSSGSTLLNIVNDILDISKIEAGRLELFPGEYAVPSLINDVITQNILRIGSKLIEFKLDISADIPSVLCGDELRVKQVLNNLLSNAFKYTKEGTVEFGMKSGRENDGETIWVTAWVKDTGVGIHKEDIPKLFSDYSQVDTKANRKIEGTGLGLSITRKLIKLMGGDISVESEYGRGSVFTVRFKQKFVTDVPVGETVVGNLQKFRYSNDKRNQHSRIARIKMPYARVLVVDDNLTNLDVAKGLMKPYGMEIDCVTGGQQAIDAILDVDVRYNAIFMDHMMPEMDGIEATRRIREIGTDYAKNIPIIALTANAITGSEEKFYHEGFQGFLSKPIELHRLDETLRRWVRDKETELPDIPGVDFKKGLSMMGGSMDTYLSVLRSFAHNTPDILEKLSGVTADNLLEYAVVVHGLKGSAASIGAEGIRETGLKLEMKSKAGDLPGVLELNDAFLRDVNAVINSINAWAGRQETKSGKPRQNAPDPEKLAKLRQSLIEYDINSIDAIMDELESKEYDTDAGLIPWLKQKIIASDFDEAILKITA